MSRERVAAASEYRARRMRQRSYVYQCNGQGNKICARKFAKETAIREVCVKYFCGVESGMTKQEVLAAKRQLTHDTLLILGSRFHPSSSVTGYDSSIQCEI
jgi:hypothetical protein